MKNSTLTYMNKEGKLHATTKPTAIQYTPFSRKLTGSLDQISKTIQENAKVIDMIQEVALELTTSISTMHALTVK